MTKFFIFAATALSIALFPLASGSAHAACTSPAGIAGTVEYFPGSEACGPMQGGMTCDPLASILDSTTTPTSTGCRAFCMTYPSASCCEWSDNGSGSCRVHDSSAIQPYVSGVYTEASSCGVPTPGVYKACDDTQWRAIETMIAAPPAPPRVLLAGTNATCALRDDDVMMCWGNNARYGLGNLTATNSNIPVVVSGHTWKAITGLQEYFFDDANAVNGQASYGIRSDGTLYQWGERNETIAGSDGIHAPLNFDAGNWADVSSSRFYRYYTGAMIDTELRNGCAIDTDGFAYCWGNNYYGQLANGSSGTGTSWMAPVNVVDDAGDNTSLWKQISVGGFFFACAIKIDDTLWCWGDNSYGQGATWSSPNLFPAQISDSGPWQTVSSGNMHTCGIKQNGSAWCWGSGSDGRLGDGIGLQSWDPVALAESGPWKDISAGGDHTCGIKVDGSLWCWGDNSYGQIGIEFVGSSLVPSAVWWGETWLNVSAGQYHTCAIRSDATIWCWGKGDEGALGNGANSSYQVSPVQVSGGHTWQSPSLGSGSCSNDGAFDLNAADSRLTVCLGGKMNNVSYTGGGFGSCGQTGRIEFFSATNTYALCNGTQWTYFKYAPCPPSAFSFNNLTNQSRSAQVNSNIVQITGMGCDGPVTVSGGGGEYRVCSDSSCASVAQNWASTERMISNNQYLQLRHYTSGAEASTMTTDATVGGVTGSWSSETCTNMPSLPFSDLTGQTMISTVTSNIVQINLTCGTTTTVNSATGAGSPQYRVCSDSSCASVVQNWTSGYTALTSGQYLQLRVTTAASALTARSVDITVGGSTDNWSATTASGWKIAFLSPTARPATLGSVAGIDTYCQNTANGAGLGGTYKGWVSGAAGQDPATTFTQSSVPYRLTTGTAIANNWADLIDGTLAAAINVSESGSTIATTMEVWSNTNANGTRIGAVNCGNWSSPAGSGRHGTASSATATWSDTNQLACSNYRRFYCFQQ